MSRKPGDAAGSSWIAPGLVLAALFFSAFSVRPHSVAVFFSVTGFVWAGWCTCRKGVSEAERRARTAFFTGAAVLLALMIVYYFNASHRWKDGVGALPVSHIGFLPASTFPEGTLKAIGFSAMMLVAGGLAMSFDRRGVEMFYAVVAAVAAVTALIVLGQRLSSLPFPVFEATGFFAYENHFSAFANLVLPLVLCAGARHKNRAFQSGKVSSPAVCLWWATALIVAAVIASRSRAGLLITGLIVLVFILQQIRLQKKFPFMMPPVSRLMKVGVGGGALVAAGAGVGAIVCGRIHLSGLGSEFLFRAGILSDTLSIWREKPFWGSGPGSFAAIFPYYQSLPLEKFSFLHAHCEPLEFLAEYGLFGGGVVLAAVLWILLPRLPRNPIPNVKFKVSNLDAERDGLWLALAGVGLHSLVDFPLRHPLNALLAAVWVGILFARCRTERQKMMRRVV